MTKSLKRRGVSYGIFLGMFMMVLQACSPSKSGKKEDTEVETPLGTSSVQRAADINNCQAAEGRFCVEYYPNPTLEGDPLEGPEVESIHWALEEASPMPDIPENQFSIRYLGRFAFDAGTHRFITKADDGVRIFVDDQLIIDAWQDSSNVTQSADVELSAGVHVVVVEYRDQWWHANLDVDWVRLEPMDCSTLNAFCGDYFGNTTLSGNPIHSEQIEVLDKSWGSAAPGPHVGANQFSARWSGSFEFVEDNYEFVATPDDGIRVILDGTPIIDEWQNQGGVSFSTILPISAGVHEVVVEYYEEWGNAVAQVEWIAQNPPEPDPEPDPIPVPDIEAEPYSMPDFSQVPLNIDNQNTAVGTNISPIKYWSTEWTLTDIFKASGGWFTQNSSSWNTEEQALMDVDAHGWIKSLPRASDPNVQFRYVGALMLQGDGGHHPAGQYTVTYEGEGTLEYGHDAVKVEELSRPGRDVIQVDNPSNGGILLRIRVTDPEKTGNYLRNIHVFMPGGFCEANDPFSYCPDVNNFDQYYPQYKFHPLFLQNIKNRRLIRFMPFLQTPANPLKTWEERPQYTDARWNSDFGAPVELALELAHLLNADAWINLPYQAENGYVEGFAALAHSMLRPSQHIYVEYGNEPWNNAYPFGVDANYYQDQGIARWPDVTNDDSGFARRLTWYGMRASELCGIWKSVWQTDAERTQCVIGGFAANAWASDMMLKCPYYAEEVGGRACHENMDGLAIAPYFGGYLGLSRFETEVEGWLTEPDGGLDKLFEELTVGGLLYDPTHEPARERSPEFGALNASFDYMEANKSVADLYQVDMVAYEGGQHIVGVGSVMDNADVVELFHKANRDVRMKVLYEQYFDGWKARGGQVFANFQSVESFGRHGSFGVKEYQSQGPTPKWEAVEEFMTTNPCWWQDCSLMR